ncbi:hypothetical protein [Thioalkalivibrio sp. ALJ16]|uniref:hypothetical protein n=1 Tax=Thioalkalivibrio sp. ALJ16 TaxID=1158762 RepID=UPI00037037B3|nr:hypothetical protein [Thioalkalivibrio sp. ALJ16]
MKRSTAIMATLAIAPFALLVGCADDGMDMDEFEQQQMEQQEMQQDGGMQAPPAEGEMQEPPEGDPMPEPEGSMEPQEGQEGGGAEF